MQEINKRLNTQKGSNTNINVAIDKEIDLSLGKRAKMIGDGVKAQAKITTDIAMTTIKNASITGHKGGVTALKGSAPAVCMVAGISFLNNTAAYLNGQKGIDDVVTDTTLDVGKVVALSYGTGFAMTDITIVMRNSTSDLKSLANTKIPGQVLFASLQSVSILKSYFTGDISGKECLSEFGKMGLGMAALEIVGATVMFGFSLAQICYGTIKAAYLEAKYAREERIRIEAECEQAIKAIREFRVEMEIAINTYLAEHEACFSHAFYKMTESIINGDADGVIDGANMISRKLGGNPQFETVDEFDALMASPLAFKI